MSDAVLATNQYSGEHRCRSDLAATLDEHGYHVKQYRLTDTGSERVLSVTAVRTLGAQQTTLHFNTDPHSHPDNV